MAKLNSERQVNKIVALQVKPGIEEHALRIGVAAEAALDRHHKRGEHQITVNSGRVDAYVNIEGPAALSIEEGHFGGYKGDRKYVEGLHILRDAAKGE